MASIKFEKGCSEWMMFQDFWKIVQTHWIFENKQTYWNELVKDLGEFNTKYEEIPLSKNLMIAFLDTQEQKSKITQERLDK